MSLQSTKSQQTQPAAPNDERILVVKRTDLMPDGGWKGIKQVNFDQYLQIINEKKQFLWRSDMENDPTYKQIIPYLIFNFNQNYFLMQRRSTASETRLRNKYSLGIGGHIRQEDMTKAASIFDWAKREFHEEVYYDGKLDIKPIGIVNDDTTTVGKVHLGFVLLLTGNSDNIRVKSELKGGSLMTLADCMHYYENLEPWSQEALKLLDIR